MGTFWEVWPLTTASSEDKGIDKAQHGHACLLAFLPTLNCEAEFLGRDGMHSHFPFRFLMDGRPRLR